MFYANLISFVNLPTDDAFEIVRVFGYFGMDLMLSLYITHDYDYFCPSTRGSTSQGREN
jgi:hypothetical protein